jgi:short subunit dehydrogenase-like uncharacterized protein
VLFGATGFTGQLAATYLAKRYGAGQFKWAIAGRRKDALEKIRSEIAQYDPTLSQLPIVLIDSPNSSSFSS